MQRREFLGGLATAPLARAAAPRRPNFLFLFSDQFRGDALGVAGNTFVHTPNLDRLAGQSVWFSHAYTPQALCTPARGALLSGCYPHTNKLDHNVYGVPSVFQMPEFQLQPNWPTLLRQAGYYTGYVGKWHLGEDNPGIFDYYNGFNSRLSHWMGEPYESAYRSDVETEDAGKFLAEHGKKPFALYLSWYPPHTKYNPPKKYYEFYTGKNVDKMEYYAAVTAIDDNVGRILARLDSLGLAKDTMVIFTSDHGDTFGRRLGSLNKTVCYEESARVPMMIRWPGRLPANLEYPGGVSTLDLMPTMLEAAGLPVPARLQGRTLLRDMERRQTAWKDPVCFENITQKDVEGKPLIERAVRTERWKLILRDRIRDEFYDLEADPLEKNDLFSKPESRATIRQLSKALLAWGERTKDPVAIAYARRYTA